MYLTTRKKEKDTMKTTRITKTATGTYGAFIIDNYKGEEQVLDCRWFKTENGAKRWVEKNK